MTLLLISLAIYWNVAGFVMAIQVASTNSKHFKSIWHQILFWFLTGPLVWFGALFMGIIIGAICLVEWTGNQLLTEDGKENRDKNREALDDMMGPM